jgi:hypothetical protein
VAWEIQVQLSLHPVAERPFSTDTIQAQAKVCPGSFQQGRPRCLGKILSEPFRGLLAMDLPGQVSRVECVDSMEEMEAMHIVRIDDSVVYDHIRLFHVKVSDSATLIQTTELIVGQVSSPAKETLGFGYGLFEREVLEAMQGIGMNEGADWPLFVKNFRRMGHLRAKAFPLGVRGRGEDF